MARKIIPEPPRFRADGGTRGGENFASDLVFEPARRQTTQKVPCNDCGRPFRLHGERPGSCVTLCDACVGRRVVQIVAGRAKNRNAQGHVQRRRRVTPGGNQ